VIGGEAVALLDLALQPPTPSLDDLQIFISEPEPLFLDFASRLLPPRFNMVPIHASLLNQHE
jgi:hypothetical protein